MHILYLHQHFTTPQGASGTRSYEMAQRLIVAGHQVTIVCGSFAAGQTGLQASFSKGQRRGVVDGINIIEFELPYSNKDSFIKRTLTFLHFATLNILTVLKEPYDLLFATTTPLTVALPALCAKWFRQKDYVFEVRDLWPELPKAMGVIRNPVILMLMDWLETLAYRNAKACIGLSPGIIKGIKNKAPDKPTMMIPNGCDLELFNANANSSDFRKKIDASEKDLVAIFSGTHGIANGLDALIDVAETLKERDVQNVKIVLIGDGKLKNSLVAKTAQLNVETIVKFLPPVPKTELANIFTQVDIGLMVLANVEAFYWGTSPNKFFDYIAAGLPVISNYPGWLAEMIEQNNLGLCVPPGDSGFLCNALIKLNKDRKLRDEMSKNAIELAKKNFCRDLLAKRFVQFLEHHTTN